jgi:hypothetical protein
MKSIRLDCGKGDPYGVQWGYQQIADILRLNGIEAELNEYSGHTQSPRSKISQSDLGLGFGDRLNFYRMNHKKFY